MNQRKLRESWQFKNPRYRAAWMWLLICANWGDGNGLKKGQVRFSLSEGRKEWGMSKKATSRFLTRCAQNGDIIWERGLPGRRSDTFFDTNPDTNPDTNSGLITICDYCSLIGLKEGGDTINDTFVDTNRGPLLNIEKKNRKEIKKREEGEYEGEAPPTPPPNPDEPRIPKDKQIKAIRDMLPDLQQQYPELDVVMELENMLDRVLEKGERPKDYKAKFRRWLRNAEKWRKERLGSQGEDWEKGFLGKEEA